MVLPSRFVSLMTISISLSAEASSKKLYIAMHDTEEPSLMVSLLWQAFHRRREPSRRVHFGSLFQDPELLLRRKAIPVQEHACRS